MKLSACFSRSHEEAKPDIRRKLCRVHLQALARMGYQHLRRHPRNISEEKMSCDS